MSLLFARFNSPRRPEFRTATLICRDAQGAWVLKRALCPAARPHLERLHAAHQEFPRQVRGTALRLPALRSANADGLVFEFVDGPSLDTLLFTALENRQADRFLALADQFVERLRSALSPAPPPGPQPEMEAVFGPLDFSAPADWEPFVAPVPLDLIAENLIARADHYALIDNEWMFPGCLPLGYLVYRAFFFLHQKYSEFGLGDFMPLPQLAARYGITAAAAAVYRRLEEHFQAMVHGPARQGFKFRYRQGVETIPHLQELIAEQQAQLRELRGKEAMLNEILNARGYRLLRAGCRALDRLRPARPPAAPPG